MTDEFWRTIEAGLISLGHGMPEMLCVPIDDDGGQQVQTSHAVMLAFRAAVADFALPADAEGVFQGVMSLALVETDLCAALHVGDRPAKALWRCTGAFSYAA